MASIKPLNVTAAQATKNSTKKPAPSTSRERCEKTIHGRLDGLRVLLDEVLLEHQHIDHHRVLLRGDQNLPGIGLCPDAREVRLVSQRSIALPGDERLRGGLRRERRADHVL